MAPFTRIEADRGDTNVYDLDANIVLDPVNDKIWFTAKRGRKDTDANAVVRLGLNVAGLTGIAVTDAATGKFQAQIPRATLASVEDFALLYDCQIFDASQNGDFTVQSGVMVLTGEVTQSS